MTHPLSQTQFVDRKEELRLLQAHAHKAGLLIMLGRRRLGKTSLLKKFISKNSGVISQAVEAAMDIQLALTTEDISQKIKLAAKPNNWLELLRLVDTSGQRSIICLDEFQYLVKMDPSLPSVLQKWLDHENKLGSLIILAGSSTKVMREVCLDANAPLYGRARQVFNLTPIDYQYFAEYLAINPKSEQSFALYALVGGVPKYWEYLKIIKTMRKLRKVTALRVIDDLFFASSPFMEGEVGRILNDEKIDGIAPLSVLEAIGRGSNRPSEISARLGVPQAQLSKLFEQLVTAKIISRETPFASPEKNNKIVNYKITDPSAYAWYALASTHRNRWAGYHEDFKQDILNTYTAQIFEQYVRSTKLAGQRYWNSDLEIDLLYVKGKNLHVAEIKWKKLSVQAAEAEVLGVIRKLRQLSFLKDYSNVFIEIYDQSFLESGECLLSTTYSTL